MSCAQPAVWQRLWYTSGLLLASIILIAGCARPVSVLDPFDLKNNLWTGRLALQVESEPPQSFSAGFELRGNAESGELSLFSPLGNTLAVLNWSQGTASLNARGRVQEFDSLDELLTHTTGTPIPIAALFDWLAGTQTSGIGWSADLAQLAQGKLQATRHTPDPVAVLRLVLDQ